MLDVGLNATRITIGLPVEIPPSIPLAAIASRLAADIYGLDILAEDGRGEEAVRDYILHNRRHHAVHRRVREVGMRVNPLSLDELRDVTDIWAEHAMKLQEMDLRNMERLASAQLRRVQRVNS